jgi:putative transcriptional regulator
MTKFGKELIQSAKEAVEIAKGEADSKTYRVHVPGEIDVRAIRQRLDMTQVAFAGRFGFAVSAVRDWEYGRRTPDRAARVLLMVIDHNFAAVDRALEAHAPRPVGKLRA